MIKGRIKLLNKKEGLIEFSYGNKYYPKSIKLTATGDALNKWFWVGDTTIACLTSNNEIVPNLGRGKQITINGNGYNLTAVDMHDFLVYKGGPIRLGTIECVFCV